MMTRRGSFTVFAAALIAPIAAYAQTGGMPSSTAPSNSQGTPATGGAIGSTQVEGGAAASTPTTTRRRRRTRSHHRTKASTGQ